VNYIKSDKGGLKPKHSALRLVALGLMSVVFSVSVAWFQLPGFRFSSKKRMLNLKKGFSADFLQNAKEAQLPQRKQCQGR